MAEYSRPQEGFRFDWGGMKTNSQPDSIPPNKYATAMNVRATSDRSLQTRPGYVSLFNCGNNAVTDIRSYAPIGTDDAPRFLARDAVNGIYLDTGSLKTTLAGNNGYGASMIPFRPGASSQPWMYIASVGDYQKISAPDGNNNTTAQKVGIAEPQSQLEAAPNAPTFTTFGATAASWTQGGTAGAPSDSTLISDTVGAAVIADPVVSTLLSVQVTIPYYAPGMLATFAGTNTYPIEQVLQACATTTVAAIRYDSGSSGLCSIVPTIDLSATLSRGSLVRLNSSETVLVLSVTAGTNGTCVFRCSTAGTISAGNAISGFIAITVHGTVSTGNSIAVSTVNTAITVGTATLSKSVSAGVFSPYAQEDYIHVTLLLQNIAALTSISLIFNVSNVVDYSTSVLTYTLTGPTLAPLLLAGEVVEIHFPISTLSTDPAALNPCNGFQLQAVTTASQTISIGGLWVGGGSLPDIGTDGAPYMLRAVPRSSLTGAKGNSTPPMRYGLNLHRQSAKVTVPSASYDSQIDTWDYYATGGSITQYGYVGSAAAGASSFTFNYDDSAIAAAIAAGNTLPVQNFEPWPSIDASWSATVSGGATITAVGSFVDVSGPSSWPATILKWLPGTLITLAGFQTYTLRSRPVSISGTHYLFEIEECVGSQSPSSVSVAEPIVANQILPYVWGPDAYGVVFGNGDPLRPGTQYFTSAYNPDIAPQTNTLELSEPSTPLIGGVLVGGLSVAVSTAKWWALYPSAGGYTQVEWTVGKAAVSPYAIATDGQSVYFWARDGICKTGGQGYTSLTSEGEFDDLKNLFPHDGIAGVNISVPGTTVYAPDYSRVASFRLAIVNGLLYADYQNGSGIYCTLVCDLRSGKPAWSLDFYGNFIGCHFQPPQSPGSLVSAPSLNPLLVMGDSAGHVWKQKDLNNDNNASIVGIMATFQYDGGDFRSQPVWGDAYLDLIPAATGTVGGNNNGVSVNPLSGNVAFVAATFITPSANRQYVPISVGGQAATKFLGLQISWNDNFGNNQSVPTTLYGWQPSFVMKPEIIQNRIGDWAGSLAG